MRPASSSVCSPSLMADTPLTMRGGSRRGSVCAARRSCFVRLPGRPDQAQTVGRFITLAGVIQPTTARRLGRNGNPFVGRRVTERNVEQPGGETKRALAPGSGDQFAQRANSVAPGARWPSTCERTAPNRGYGADVHDAFTQDRDIGLALPTRAAVVQGSSSYHYVDEWKITHVIWHARRRSCHREGNGKNLATRVPPDLTKRNSPVDAVVSTTGQRAGWGH